VIAEQKLTLSHLIDPSSAKKLGKLLGVDAIVSGTITDLGISLRVNARLIGTETGEVFAVAACRLTKDEDVRRLMAPMSIQGRSHSLSTGNPLRPQPAITGTGKHVEFDNVGYEQDSPRLTIKLLSMETVEKGKAKFDFIFSQASWKDGANIGMHEAKRRVYIATSDGDRIDFYSCSGFELEKWRRVPSDLPVRFSVVFSRVPPMNQEFSIVLSLNWGSFGDYEYIIRGVRIPS
jgi:hypothetical protein